ncbi:MAG TPA: hypothetical protein VFZ53_10395, partial [Polyangiaceae bacterium]
MTRRVEAKAWAVASSVSFVAVVSAASPVRASERAPFFLEYAAAPGCPDRHAWLEEVSRRSSRVVPASANERAPTLRVELTQLADRVRAELAAIDVGGRETRRTVFASNCREAVEGSAWIAAVWLDPSLRPQGPALPIPPAPPPPPAPPATRAQPIAPIADDPNPGARAT